MHMTSPEMTKRLMEAHFPDECHYGKGFILTEILAELPPNSRIERTDKAWMAWSVTPYVFPRFSPNPCDAAGEVWLAVNKKEAQHAAP